MIKTRKANLEDLPILLDFEQELIKAERPFDKTLKEGKISYYDIKAMILSDEVEVMVAVENDEIIGSGYARIVIPKSYFKFDKFAYLGFMYVKPTHRGKGVNKKVVEALNTWILSRNVSEVRLDVYAENQGAIRAYEKVNFKKNLINMRMSL
ncbi:MULTISPECIES: GNAT family N-acetyltransferase [unclassified Tenacibaculum]|uniref:GNAT family N-acetyltransferase n=1 Tax=unclassified Tenacibaculum TaxID=2635139 RepID=UPI001F177592|nr:MULTISPECIES: GNAT family N-acetyltransferase [unclassified Tenacibaculum]MCF2874107.1 GNAT family N-acetyltransferase [Tenacibaculum sp. Cn5-1]MCF2934688.1 GNAT family N-acetyltransferase [Tenacibaculum sp. Cn5-34]MCG7510898.1 GNAT family N-acetyltransferase [Tenacibaculum sp. Cn5-46]